MRRVNGFERMKIQEDSVLEKTTADEDSTVLNHYEVPNLSSMLYEFTNREQDRVNQCFRIGNFLSLRHLPTFIMPGNVSQMT
jgi:hypothetical protein